MRWLANMSIGSRLGVGFAAVIALLIVLASVGISRIDAMLCNTELILHDRFANVALAHAIENDMNLQARGLRTALITTDISIVNSEVAKVGDADRNIEASVTRLRGSVHTDADRQALDRLVKQRQAFDRTKEKLLALVAAQSFDEGAPYLVKEMLPVQATYLAALDAFMRSQVESMQRFGSEATQTAKNAKIVMVGLALAAVVLAVAIAVSMTRSITGPIAQAVHVARTVAAGDLTSHVEVHRTDEAGQLLSALVKMNEGLTGIVRQVREGSESISTGASQIATGNADLSHRTEEQASSLQETASSMEEINATVRQNVESARQAEELARNSNELTARGSQMVKNVVATMSAIQGSSKRIADITGVIDGIAFQTNILALNAAVEAARAGEQGRGFAVVATEVRNLAQRSAMAAKEIKALIMESVEKVATGTKAVNDAGIAMDEIVTSFQKVTLLVGDISHANREQASGIEQVTLAIGQMDEVTQQNAALVEEAAAAAESLEEQATGLVQAVGLFKLNVERLPKGQSTHLRHLPQKNFASGRSVMKGTPKAASLPRMSKSDNGEWAEF